MSVVQAHLCSVCNQPHEVAVARKESLTKIKCELLKSAAARVIEIGANRFKLRDLDNEPSRYNNFQKLRYHGLIAHARENGQAVPGEWLVTRNGWAFLRGELKLPKFVMVRDNHPLEHGRSDVLVGLLDVLKGGDYIETTFDYFDHDTGQMIARAPYQPASPPVQRALL